MKDIKTIQFEYILLILFIIGFLGGIVVGLS